MKTSVKIKELREIINEFWRAYRTRLELSQRLMMDCCVCRISLSKRKENLNSIYPPRRSTLRVSEPLTEVGGGQLYKLFGAFQNCG